MRTKIIIFPIFFLLFSISVMPKGLEELARQAVSPDAAEAGSAISSLRARGQNGLDALFRVYQTDIEEYKKTGRSNDSWKMISRAIDSVAMQKDAYASRLYWQTDLAEAEKLATETGKPILSLRLLGNLNEEFSCANSRFFRALLYSDPLISETLRERYILHWRSVRPAPRITIDFGDGRKIERTITGNSIHYVLDANGRILDALPGLYNPAEFLNFLDETANLHRNARRNPLILSDYRNIRRSQLLNKWRADLEKIGARIPTESVEITSSSLTINDPPTALEAAPRAATKMMVEMPTVRTLAPEETLLKADTEFEDWYKLAALFGQVAISEPSRAFIRRQTAGNSDLTPAAFEELIKRLETSVSLDTVRNEYLFHPTIYRWLAENPEADVESFNERVYNELFLTPRSDEWLGLYAADIYSALDGNGVIR